MGLTSLKQQIEKLLKPIIAKEGAFSRDPIIHANNCINLASENAKKVLGLLADCVCISRKELEEEITKAWNEQKKLKVFTPDHSYWIGYRVLADKLLGAKK